MPRIWLLLPALALGIPHSTLVNTDTRRAYISASCVHYVDNNISFLENYHHSCPVSSDHDMQITTACVSEEGYGGGPPS